MRNQIDQNLYYSTLNIETYIMKTEVMTSDYWALTQSKPIFSYLVLSKLLQTNSISSAMGTDPIGRMLQPSNADIGILEVTILSIILALLVLVAIVIIVLYKRGIIMR